MPLPMENNPRVIFERMFGKDAMLDIVFLSAEQETELVGVCRAFYSTPSG